MVYNEESEIYDLDPEKVTDNYSYIPFDLLQKSDLMNENDPATSNKNTNPLTRAEISLKNEVL